MECDGSRCRLNRDGAERSIEARLGGDNHKRSSHVELLGEDTNMKKALVSIAFGLTASLFATGASAQATLNSVKQKGFLTCGSNTGLAGFGQPDAQGNWTGLDVDFCRDLRRPDQGSFHSARCQGPLHGAPVRRSGRAVPYHDAHHVTRHAARP